LKSTHLSASKDCLVCILHPKEQKGLSCRSPKDCFRTAFQQEIIDFDNYWIVITDWRNSAVHTYKESIAEELYGELPKILEKFEELEKRLQNW
jgi:hypothetical protein